MTTIESTLDWSGQFSDIDTESSYRKHRRESDRALLRIICVIVVGGVGSFIVNDIRGTHSGGPAWGPLAASRLPVILFALFYAINLSKIQKTEVLDSYTFLLALTVMLAVFWIDASRPRGFYTHIGMDIIVLISIYLIVPISQVLRFVVTAGFTTGLLLLYFVYKELPDTLTSASVIIALTVANSIGLLSSLRIARIQRAEFAALKSEQRARLALQEAQQEIKSLTGLIPICASCKNVRNDQGYWEQVESYVRDRSDAQFSHGMCPNCEKEYTD